MEITEIRMTPGDVGGGRVRAYCSMTIDAALAIHNIKLVESPTGRLLVCMPSAKARVRCGCGRRNDWDARFCGRCGARSEPAARPEVHHHDVCHPVSTESRLAIESRVLAAYADWSAPAAARAAD